MTISQAIEDAVYSRMNTGFSGSVYDPLIAPFVATTGRSEQPLRYPAVQFAAEPVTADHAGSPLGYVTLRLAVRTHADDDADRAILESVFNTATTQITAALLGPLVYSPWLLCGIDTTQEGGVSVDPEAKTQDKGRTYRVAVALIATTTTTTTTT